LGWVGSGRVGWLGGGSARGWGCVRSYLPSCRPRRAALCLLMLRATFSWSRARLSSRRSVSSLLLSRLTCASRLCPCFISMLQMYLCTPPYCKQRTCPVVAVHTCIARSIETETTSAAAVQWRQASDATHGWLEQLLERESRAPDYVHM